MKKPINKLFKLRKMQKLLENSYDGFNDLIIERKKLNQMLIELSEITDVTDIPHDIKIIDYQLNEFAWKLNDVAREVKIHMRHLGFSEEFIYEVTECKAISIDIQYSLIKEIVNIFRLDIDTDVVIRNILSRKLDSVFFSDILRAILEV